MTEEEKKLLFKDLCARAPYGTNIAYNAYGKLPISRNFGISIYDLLFEGYDIEHCKPYLRPMSSMTEEEYNCVYNGHIDFWSRCDYCNSHHLDYRGLIEKGLALEAPKDMYEN